MAERILFHVQHLLGIGHLKRAAAIARAAADAGLEVTVASGGFPAPGTDFGRARIVQLPPARAEDDSFKVLLDEAGRPIDDAWKAARREKLLEVFRDVKPDVILFELFPFGRRQFRFEILPLLDAAAQVRPRPAIACSVRDILVEKPRPERNREVVDTVRKYFDAVLVHGDPALIGFAETFSLATEIEDRIRYTGYVADGAPIGPSAGKATPEVVVSAGGGSVGEPLMRAALAARPLTKATGLPWRLLTGPNLPDAVFEDLRRSAPSGVTVERHRADFRNLLAASAVSISQAGYNTVMDLLGSGARAVVVPFAGGQESEQSVRARLLAKRGWLEMVEPDDLTPETLARAVDRVLAATPPAVAGIDLNGMVRAAGELRALARKARRAA